jgi:hypothetical protein
VVVPFGRDIRLGDSLPGTSDGDSRVGDSESRD